MENADNESRKVGDHHGAVSAENPRRAPAEKPVSLAPLDAESAMEALLAVKPAAKEKRRR